MLIQLFTKILGSKNSRELKRYQKIVRTINEIEPRFEILSDAELMDKKIFSKKGFPTERLLIRFYQKHLQPLEKQVREL